MYIHTYTYSLICLFMYMYVYIYIYIYMYTHIHIYMYTYTYTYTYETPRQGPPTQGPRADAIVTICICIMYKYTDFPGIDTYYLLLYYYTSER